jgi:hypothetical protein
MLLKATLLSPHLIVGEVIATPAVPVVCGKVPQVSVGAGLTVSVPAQVAV